jgi:hypothetical protein
MPRKTKTAKPAAKKAKSTKTKKPAAATGSIVRAEYRERYEDGSCGDDLAAKLRKHTLGADGKTDVAKLKALAEANNAWRSEYSSLNAGMQRMNIGNRLRKIVRDGGKVVWS